MILDKEFEAAKQKDKIKYRCDYCGCISERLKHNVVRSYKIIKKDSCSDYKCVQKKRIESNLKQFGTSNAFQNDEFKEKIKKTNLERYGVENPFQNKGIREKQKQTVLKKYDTENVFQNDEIKEKSKKTNLKKYGVENAFQNKEIRERQQNTLVKKYGVSHALQNDQLRQKAMNTCVANYGCFPANNYGKTQANIQEWLNSFGNNFSSTRSLIVGKEIDLYDKNKKVAIEYCGLYWHNEFSPEPRNNKYHSFKMDECTKQGIQLITIFSDEWIDRNFQCKSHIKSILGINDKRIYGRKCEVKEIEKKVGKDFFQEYHIQGKNRLGIAFYGLFHDQELVGAISLGRHNRQYNNLVLDRLCFKDGIQVAGGASKLFKRCIKWASDNNYNEILSFSDNRWSLGSVYNALKFKLDKDMRPDYSYVDIKKANKRISKQSQKKQNTNCPDGMTECEWAHSRGLARIWDCGKKRWIYEV
jgi:hypothetical protein